MAVSTKGRTISVGASEGLFEADRNSGEPENTYILRPIFQQRRVVVGALRAMWVGSGAWALQCHQGDAERGGAARALAFRCGDFSTLQRDWSVFPGTLDWRTGVVDLLEALGGAHPGQTKQRLETSNLLAVL